MGSSVVDPDLRLALVLVALTALAAAAGRFSGPGEERPILVAAARATVQLAVVSAVLLAVVGSLALATAFVGAAQLLVLVGLLTAEMLAVWTVTELVGRGALLDDVPR